MEKLHKYTRIREILYNRVSLKGELMPPNPSVGGINSPFKHTTHRVLAYQSPVF